MKNPTWEQERDALVQQFTEALVKAFERSIDEIDRLMLAEPVPPSVYEGVTK